MGTDLFLGKFQQTLEEEAKRIKATDKMNQRKSSQNVSGPGRGGKPGSGPRFPRKPLELQVVLHRLAQLTPTLPHSHCWLPVPRAAATIGVPGFHTPLAPKLIMGAVGVGHGVGDAFLLAAPYYGPVGAASSLSQTLGPFCATTDGCSILSLMDTNLNS